MRSILPETGKGCPCSAVEESLTSHLPTVIWTGENVAKVSLDLPKDVYKQSLDGETHFFFFFLVCSEM